MTMTDDTTGVERTDPAARTVEIDFLYIDLDTCRRCGSTELNLDEAIELARPVLAAADIEITLTKRLMESSGQATEHRLLSSPTIRIGDADIAGVLLESTCSDCGALSACGDDTQCRVWSYRREEFSAAPTGLIVEAILAAAVGVTPAINPYPGLPENLERFFDGTASTAAGESDCGCGSSC